MGLLMLAPIQPHILPRVAATFAAESLLRAQRLTFDLRAELAARGGSAEDFGTAYFVNGAMFGGQRG